VSRKSELDSKKHRFISRRDLLFQAGEGIGGLGLAYILNQQGLLAAEPPAESGSKSCASSAGTNSPLAAKPPHFKPRAKAMISLFMSGGVSHVDTFDPKPMLAKYHGQLLTSKGEIRLRQGYPGPLMKSPYQFKKYGQSGVEVSDLFPHIGGMVDDLAIIRSCQGRSSDHTLAHFEWNTGSVLMGFPSVGAWVTYGLGTENENVPAFVVIPDPRGGPYSGPVNWSSGFLPAAYQGTSFRSTGEPILDLTPPSTYLSGEEQRDRLDLLARLNQNHAERVPGSSELAARIASYELAYRMQGCAPEAVDISKESDETRRLYGLDHPITEPFGKQCLLARRLVERGVRFVQLFNGTPDNGHYYSWDAHENIVENHGARALEIDKPIAGLIQDLKLRGLFDSTLLFWHSEFGRMPISQRGVGRDHNPGAMSVWMAGGGVKGGQAIGASDEFGYQAQEQPATVHDIHATILNLLGMDHKRLTYFFNGRHMRLTDVHGELIPEIAGV
jgi:hypothetical protein